MEKPVVVELGSLYIRAGRPDPTNEREPWVVTAAEALVGPSTSTGTEVAVAAAAGGRGLTRVHPIQRGLITDWDALESILHYVLYDRMGFLPGQEGSLMVAEPMFMSRDERERMCQLAFEVFNVPSYFASDAAVLSLYAVARATGIVVDVGHDKIDIAPVLDGLSQPSGARRLPYGGRQLTQHLKQLLAARGVALGGLEAAEQVKQQCMRVAESADAAAGAAPEAEEPPTCTLPDGREVVLAGEGVALGEALLDPGTHLGLDLPPLAEAVYAAAMALGDKEARKVLLENVCLCGGGSLVPGLGSRLLRELRLLAHPLAVGLCTRPEYMPERSVGHAAWVGAALLTKSVLLQQPSQVVTKGDYEEWGPAAVHRKCS